jgi:hypothetical protein
MLARCLLWFLRLAKEPAMKSLLVAVAAALVSASVAVGSGGVFTGVGNFTGVSSERELAVSMPLSGEAADAVLPFIEKAAREGGLTRIRAYDHAVFIPLEQASLSFVNDKGNLTLHVAVESEYRFKKAERHAALEALKAQGNSLFARALMLQGAAR